MSNLLKKVTLSFLSALVLLFSFAPYFEAYAQDSNSTAWYDQNFWDWHGKVYDYENPSEIFGERYTAAQVQWVLFSVGSQIIHAGGSDVTKAAVCISKTNIGDCGDEIKNALNPLSDAQNGPTKTVLSFFDSQPLSGIGYVRQKINNFHLIPEANAQGTGFTAASPIQTLWVAFRNLTFGLMVIVVLIMAFMIMFRVKISPQAVITVQSALPKIAGALILITFSYAIAGFMIDIMYLVMGILATFLTSSGISTLKATEIFSTLNNGSVLVLSMKYCAYFWFAMMEAVSSAGGGGTVGILLGATVGNVLGFLIAVIAFFLLLWYTIKIFWLLIKTYVGVLLQIALSPIQILLGTITPFGGFGAWLKGLAGSLAVYPVVGFMFVLSYYFLAQAYKINSPASLIPFLDFPFGININLLADSSNWSPPLTGGTEWLGILWLGVSLAVITLIPRTAEIIQGAISGKPFAYGTAIGEALGGPAGALWGSAPVKRRNNSHRKSF